MCDSMWCNSDTSKQLLRPYLRLFFKGINTSAATLTFARHRIVEGLRIFENLCWWTFDIYIYTYILDQYWSNEAYICMYVFVHIYTYVDFIRTHRRIYIYIHNYNICMYVCIHTYLSLYMSKLECWRCVKTMQVDFVRDGHPSLDVISPCTCNILFRAGGMF